MKSSKEILQETLKLPRRKLKLVHSAVEKALKRPRKSFLASMLVPLPLPHKNLTTNEYVRKNGNVKVTMVAPSEIGLPSGPIARLILALITTKILQRKPEEQNREVKFKSYRDLCWQLGLPPTGYYMKQIRKQLKHLEYTAVFYSEEIVVRVSKNGKRRMERWGKNKVLISDWGENLESIYDVAAGPERDIMIRISDEYFQELKDSSAICNFDTLKELKGSPLAMDIYTWLTHRVSRLKETVMIPWPELEAQFGSSYAHTYDFVKAFKLALKEVQLFYTKATYKAGPKGLFIFKGSRPDISKKTSEA